MDAWMQKLKDNLAELYDFDAQVNAIAKIANIEQELLEIICIPCYSMVFGCILMILIRVAMLRKITFTSFSSPALSTHTVFKCRRCLELVWALKRCARC